MCYFQNQKQNTQVKSAKTLLEKASSPDKMKVTEGALEYSLNL